MLPTLGPRSLSIVPTWSLRVRVMGYKPQWQPKSRVPGIGALQDASSISMLAGATNSRRRKEHEKKAKKEYQSQEKE